MLFIATLKMAKDGNGPLVIHDAGKLWVSWLSAWGGAHASKAGLGPIK